MLCVARQLCAWMVQMIRYALNAHPHAKVILNVHHSFNPLKLLGPLFGITHHSKMGEVGASIYRWYLRREDGITENIVNRQWRYVDGLLMVVRSVRTTNP